MSALLVVDGERGAGEAIVGTGRFHQRSHRRRQIPGPDASGTRRGASDRWETGGRSVS